MRSTINQMDNISGIYQGVVTTLRFSRHITKLPGVVEGDYRC